MITVKADELQLLTSDIYRAMGTGISPPKPKASLLQKIEQLRSTALSLLQCQYFCKITTVNEVSKTYVRVEDSFTFACNPQYFKGATKTAVILLTAGFVVEREIKRLLSVGSLLNGFILDAYANAALDELFGHIREQLDKNVSPSKLQLGYSLCPGCLLALADQQKVFSLLQSELMGTGIILRDSFMISPEKSCTYLIPIGENLFMPSTSRYACSVCPSHSTCLFSPVGKTK